ncbi:helix-turn-helix transcriptional regulator [Paenibacillus sp. LHD-117]|uniref:helix-turn-helix domain-containing protein n=1 Tax=Paenibacillus sp. LHD-117 TaxID=3071412 RepID=UPI0027E175DA|nr:helix-turn-helix transcriptional regulator [Paenibacillus sp. LHD-117]MDQ6421378.1 helix-turn-helix transcriptional regulator [Paenibacillus sp. LHD-117]
MNQIGENIRRLRKYLGLTQIEFSRQIGVSQGTLSDIEQGNCTPSVETVLSIHERYGVTLNWILKGSDKEWAVDSKVSNTG